VQHGGSVGNQMRQASVKVDMWLLAKENFAFLFTTSHWIPYHHACDMKASMAGLEPIGLVQPISSTTNIGFLPMSTLLAQAYERYEKYGTYGHGGYEGSYK